MSHPAASSSVPAPVHVPAPVPAPGPDRIAYTAEAHVTGGRDGRAATSDGVLDLRLALPKSLGGSGDGANPEQLLAIGWAACFESVLVMLARKGGLDASGVAIDARVHLVKQDDGGFALAAELDVTLPVLDAGAAAGLVREAHRFCPYSKATRGNVPVLFMANGAAVSAGDV
ncbi:osmotically inducible protein C [Actinorhabdospora filicis]|uniref:Osmotically inducible protein C n=1 Tax=Actinorhabdospora filicis TaxID=1785913 RepID=A0A9W6W879_9ACTN|nr:organic hydroperoxide resistance protein [Actinorhabdospora filicis]GLZ77314.1 osmotically inducible protein C [Actinorhabdospora filicis]